jgi:hypothetical protein
MVKQETFETANNSNTARSNDFWRILLMGSVARRLDSCHKINNGNEEGLSVDDGKNGGCGDDDSSCKCGLAQCYTPLTDKGWMSQYLICSHFKAGLPYSLTSTFLRKDVSSCGHLNAVKSVRDTQICR